MNVFRDVFAEVREFLWWQRRLRKQNVLRDLKKNVAQLREEAAAQGANAVIGVDLDYSEFSLVAANPLFLVASG